MSYANFKRIFDDLKGKPYCFQPVFTHQFIAKDQHAADGYVRRTIEFLNTKHIPMRCEEQPEEIDPGFYDEQPPDGYHIYRTFYGIDIPADDVFARNVYQVERICRSIEHFCKNLLGTVELVTDTLDTDDVIELRDDPQEKQEHIEIWK